MVVKTCLFLLKMIKVWDKYDKIQEVIKDMLGINFHSEPVQEYKYLKAKVREFDGVIKTFGLVICQNKICIILALLA